MQVDPEKDKDLHDFLKMSIRPNEADQILKFILIELPSEIETMKFVHEEPCSPEIKERINRLEEKITQVRKYKESDPRFKTIGEYYSEVIQEFWDLSDIEEKINKDSDEKVKLFSGDPRKQFTYFGNLGMANMIEIVDLRSALNQFREIVEEGEGSSIFKLTGEVNIKSHFVRFMELYTQCEVTDVTSKEEGDETIIYYTLKEKKYKSPLESKLDYEWTDENAEYVDNLIEEEYCDGNDNDNNGEEYPSVYARSTFFNNYQGIMEELDFIFNTEVEEFMKEHDVPDK